MTYGMNIEFNSDYADAIIEHCQDMGITEQESWLHLLAAAAVLCPKRETSLMCLDNIYNDTEAAAARHSS